MPDHTPTETPNNLPTLALVGHNTKAILIDTAERLFGQAGMEGVSLREIAASAGQSNNNAVQYHFGDKAGLIGAILNDRILRLEPLRREQLGDTASAQQCSTRQLLRVLWQPILSIQDDQGMHTFCRFLLQYLLHPQRVPHPVADALNPLQNTAAQQRAPSLSSHPFPSLTLAAQLLRARYHHLPAATLDRRLSGLSMMFMAMVVEHDNSRIVDNHDADADFAIEPVLDMAEGALNASW